FTWFLLASHTLHAGAEPFFGVFHHISHAIQSTLGAVVHNSVLQIHHVATVANEVHPGKISRAVDCNIENRSGLQLALGSWPVKLGSGGYALQSYAGDWHGSVNPLQQGGSVGPSMKKSRDPSKHKHGWVYMDLVQANGTRLHLQLYIHLTSAGIKEALLGHLDLSSSLETPMPSGTLGQVEFTEDSSIVKYVLIAGLENTANIETTMPIPAGHLLGKAIKVNTFVSAPSSLVSVMIQDNGRYHDYSPLSSGEEVKTLTSSKFSVDGVKKLYAGLWGMHDQKPFFSNTIEFNVLGMATTRSAFTNTSQSKALFAPDGSWTFCYGFGDSVNHYDQNLLQIYAYMTPNRENWIGDLIKEDERWNRELFSRLVLPAAHDSGMFIRLDPGLAEFIRSGKMSDVFGRMTSIVDSAVHFLVKMLEKFQVSPGRELDNSANTQKDDFPAQLKIDVRLFDFRPGYCVYDVVNLKKGVIHHQHAFIQSSGFIFQNDIVKDGNVIAYSMIPTVAELDGVLQDALQTANAGANSINVGSAIDLDTPVGDLISQNKRLILIDMVHDAKWTRADSYVSKAHSTQDPTQIITMLEKTWTDSSSLPDTAKTYAPPAGSIRRGAIYQLQATPQTDAGADVLAGLSNSDAA
ncbi:hypothetical protein FRB98_003529, partial [Tulasnella sp. 332]